jgi:AhpD family alkylhydroperoxidase
VGVLTWAFAHVAGLVAGTTAPNLFLTLGRHRSLFRGWLAFARRLMPGGRLPRRQTELAILRVAHLRSCGYEWEHHGRLARRAGLTDADLRGVEEGPQAPRWSEQDRAVLGAVDALHRQQDLDDETWRALRTHLDDRQAIELCFLVGHYEMLATVIGALRIQPDAPRALPFRLGALRRGSGSSR